MKRMIMIAVLLLAGAAIRAEDSAAWDEAKTQTETVYNQIKDQYYQLVQDAAKLQPGTFSADAKKAREIEKQKAELVKQLKVPMTAALKKYTSATRAKLTTEANIKWEIMIKALTTGRELSFRDRMEINSKMNYAQKNTQKKNKKTLE